MKYCRFILFLIGAAFLPPVLVAQDVVRPTQIVTETVIEYPRSGNTYGQIKTNVPVTRYRLQSVTAEGQVKSLDEQDVLTEVAVTGTVSRAALQSRLQQAVTEELVRRGRGTNTATLITRGLP